MWGFYSKILESPVLLLVIVSRPCSQALWPWSLEYGLGLEILVLFALLAMFRQECNIPVLCSTNLCVCVCVSLCNQFLWTICLPEIGIGNCIWASDWRKCRWPISTLNEHFQNVLHSITGCVVFCIIWADCLTLLLLESLFVVIFCSCILLASFFEPPYEDDMQLFLVIHSSVTYRHIALNSYLYVRSQLL